jgi:hypothetical protein
MKNIFLFMSFFVVGFLTQAKTFDSNSEMNMDQKNCLREGGLIQSLSWSQPREGRLEFCYFFGDQGLDLRTLRVGKLTPAGPEANQSYRATLDFTIGACQRRGGQLLKALDHDRRSRWICRFWDGSAIDQRTLENGVRSPWNRELNRALRIF